MVEVPVNRTLNLRREFARFTRRAAADETDVIAGYISETKGDAIKVMIDLDADECVEIRRDVIDCIWQPDDERQPTLIVLRSLDGITRNGNPINDEAPHSADPAAAVIAVRRRMNDSDGGNDASCAEIGVRCRNGCDAKYPSENDSPENINSLQREGCRDSCDAAERNCKWGRGGIFGSGGIFIA